MIQEQNNKRQRNESQQIQIIDDFIRQLLNDPIDEEEDDECDPNVLDQPVRVYEDNPRFINGVKQTQKPTEMKSASRPPMISEEERKTNKQYLCLQVYNIDGTTSRIIISGTAEVFHIKANQISKWLKNGINKGGMQVSKKENQRVVEVKISKKFLLARNKKRK